MKDIDGTEIQAGQKCRTLDHTNIAGLTHRAIIGATVAEVVDSPKHGELVLVRKKNGTTIPVKPEFVRVVRRSKAERIALDAAEKEAKARAERVAERQKRATIKRKK